jgi:NAD(P)H-dependent FMN reductase
MDTTKQPRVVGIHGAPEQHEIAHHALTEALTGAENAGATTDHLDLSELALPLYDPDYPEPRDAVAVMRYTSRADAVLLATSVRHDSHSTQLKNALEYCGPDEFAGKPVGLIGVADGQEPVTALGHLRTICTMLDAQVLGMQVSTIEAIGEHNELSDNSVTELRALGQQVVIRYLTESDR